MPIKLFFIMNTTLAYASTQVDEETCPEHITFVSYEDAFAVAEQQRVDDVLFDVEDYD